jgi:VTC domain
MTHTQEVRWRASETKFVVDAETGERIRSWARSFLEPDPHGTGAFGDEYKTTTLYFDTAEGHVFHQRGSFGRAKYRIRRYGQSEVVFLERKLRRPGLLVKRRTEASLDILDGGDASERWHRRGSWFERRLTARGLEAVCQLSYHRLARGMATETGPARLTLDQTVEAVAISTPRFSADDGLPVLDGRYILELKYRLHVPAAFKRLIEDFSLKPQAFSKYRLGQAALRGLPLPDEIGASERERQVRV